MIKHRNWLIAVSGVLVGTYFFVPQRSVAPTPLTAVVQTSSPVATLTRRSPASIPAQNLPSKLARTKFAEPDWKTPLEEDLRHLGGPELKDLEILRERSLNWNDRGQMVVAEAVKITLRNQNDEVTNFRALVNTGTGKIIQTWDQPVNDPINPRENPGLKLDPRYHP